MIVKKILILFFIFLLGISYTVFADDFIYDDDLLDIDFGYTYETTTEASNEPVTYSKNIVAIDRKTLSILYEKNADEKVPMASTTKIMTCILALENSNLSDIVTISKKAASIHGSILGIKEDMQFTMNDLLYGLMMRSRK